MFSINYYYQVGPAEGMDESEEGNSTLKDEEETRSSSPSSISELGNFYRFFSEILKDFLCMIFLPDLQGNQHKYCTYTFLQSKQHFFNLGPVQDAPEDLSVKKTRPNSPQSRSSCSPGTFFLIL